MGRRERIVCFGDNADDSGGPQNMPILFYRVRKDCTVGNGEHLSYDGEGNP